jgi:hypothetical protein
MEDSDWRHLPGEEDEVAPSLAHLKSEPGFYWRGMSGHEYAYVQRKGEIKSDRGRTYYSNDPHTALRFLKRRHTPGTTSYLLKFRDPGLPVEKGLTKYPAVRQAIPGHHIVEEYMVNDDMVPRKVSAMQKSSCVMDIGHDIEVLQIDPLYDPVQTATQQGAQIYQQPAVTAAWKEAADDDVPEVGSTWRWRGRNLTVKRADNSIVLYEYEDDKTSVSMPFTTWQTYVRNRRIKPYDPDKGGTHLFEPMVAWRVWGVDRTAQRIHGPVYKTPLWEPYVKFEADAVPDMGHRAGAYACATRQILAEKQGTLDQYPVLGEVNMWGRIVKATLGFRSQYCYPKTFYIRDRTLIPILEQYGVPIVWEDTAIFKFQADNWAIEPRDGKHDSGIYQLLDSGGHLMATLDTDKSLEGDPTEVNFRRIEIESTDRNTAVQHIAYWIETLVAAGVTVQWDDAVGHEHADDGDYEHEYDFDNQETHNIGNRKDLLALEEKLLTERHLFTEAQGDPVQKYENHDFKTDEYGLPKKQMTLIEQPPDYINLSMSKWVVLFQEMLADIYQGKTDDNGFNMTEPQDIKALIETFWTTLAASTGDDDISSSMSHINLGKAFPPLYTRLVRYAQSLDRMNNTQPQQEQLFDPDQYVNGVRIANPLARFALQYLENLFDMTHDPLVFHNPGPDATFFHRWKDDPGTDNANWQHVTVPNIPNTFSKRAKEAGVDPMLFDVVYSAYTHALMTTEDDHEVIRAIIYAVESQLGRGRYSMEQIGQAIEWAQKAISAAWPDIPGGSEWTNPENWREDTVLPAGLQTHLDVRVPNDPVHSATEPTFNVGDRVQVGDNWFGSPYYIGAEGVVQNIYPPHNSNSFECEVEFPATKHTPWPVTIRVPMSSLKSIIPDTLPWSDSEQDYYRTANTTDPMGWTLEDVQAAQTWVNSQLHALINWQGATSEQANTALLDEMHNAEMPDEWAKALLVEAWRSIKGEMPSGFDSSQLRQPKIPESDAIGFEAEMQAPHRNDPHMSSEG